MESPTPSCERARLWVSLALDGELSDFERAALDEHLRRCEACASFAAGLGGFTALLRAAPLEAPPTLLELPGRPRRARPALLAAAVAVVAFAAGLGTLAGTLSSRGSARAHASAVAARTAFVEQQVLALELGASPAHPAASGRVIAE